MKTFLLSIIVSISVLFFYSAAIAQNTFPSTGNVGIGTTSPGGKLTIHSGTARGLEVVSSYGNSHIPWSNGWSYLSGLGIVFRTNGDNTEQMRITPTGNVGIGTTSPGGKLTVHSGTARGLEVISSYGATHIPWSNGWSYLSGLGIVFRTNGNNTEQMRITPNGDVGIGTTFIPSGYKMAVNGKIITTEVKIKPYSTWPDYVFAPNYELKPLKELAAYIQAEKHLPGVPSAQEIAKDGGFELGQMTQTLLEKVEELTLYMIDLEEKNEALEKNIIDLREENQMIKVKMKKLEYK